MKRFLICFLLILLSLPATAKQFYVSDSGLYLKDYKTDELKKMFADAAYDDYIDLPDNEYPRIFVQNLPSDFALQEDRTLRNRFFMQILMPLILKANDEVLKEREIVDALSYGFEQNKDFDEASVFYLEELAKKYDVTTPFKDTRRYITLLDELKVKVDTVPPSLLMAAAAIRTDWGTSRIAIKANNLYKQRIWYQNEGLEPLEDKDGGYRYKIYSNLEESVKDYILKLNSDINFDTFRVARAVSRKRGSDLYGKRMAFSFVLASNLKNYAGLLDYTLTYYKMYYFDEAKLEKTYTFED